MSFAMKAIPLAVLVGLCLTVGTTLRAEEYATNNSTSAERDQSWYQTPSNQRADTRAIIQRKAQTRAAQRDARMASLNWYGMSNARPTAAPTPFMTLYSPVWQMPGGRPFAWNTGGWAASNVVYVR